MKKRSEYNSRMAFAGRSTNMIAVMMLAIMMTISGISPSLAAFAEDEDRYPAQDFSGSTSDLDIHVSASEGVFPEDTEMKTCAVSAEEVMEAAQKIAGENTEVVDAAAADITFWSRGEEIQPKKAVRVKLTAKRPVSGDSHEAVTVSDSGDASVVSGATARSGSFSTDHFTVYGIIGEEYEDVKQYARHTYKYYAGDPEKDPDSWPEVDTQTYRSGDRIVLPAEPAGSASYVFDGWYRAGEDAKLAAGDEITIDPATLDTSGPENAQAKDDIIRVFAKFERQYKVTLYTTADKRSVYDTITAKDGETVSLPPAAAAVENGIIQPDEEKMAGWKYADGTKTADNSVTIDKADIELVPDFSKAHIVTFEMVMEVFTPIAGQRVMDGESAERPADFLEGEIYRGYEFGGWYKRYYPNADDPDGMFSDPFDFGHIFDECDPAEITLYARFIPADVTYTIEVYQENAHEHEEDFSLLTRFQRECRSDSIAPVADILGEFGNSKYDYFHWSGNGKVDGGSERAVIEVVNGPDSVDFNMDADCIGDESKAKINSDGSTIVRIYYCRDTYYINFWYSNRNGRNVVNGGPSARDRNLNMAGQGYAPAGYAEYTAPTVTAKYREWLHECTHITDTTHSAMLDAFLADTEWYFERLDFNGSGETVFDESNRQTPVTPNSNIGDGGDLHVLIYLNGGQKTYRYQALYYDKEYPAEEINNGGITAVKSDPAVEFNYMPKGARGHLHTWTIGSTRDGYRLVTVTGYSEVRVSDEWMSGPRVLPDGTHSFSWVNGLAEEDVETIYLHYVPSAYTITFRQTNDQRGSRNYVYGYPVSDDTQEDDVVAEGIFCGEDITEVIRDHMPAGWSGLKDVRGRVYHAEDIWYGDTDGGAFPSKMPAKDIVFYKKWTRDSYTVTFDLDHDGKVYDHRDIPWGGAVPDPATPGYTARDGYTFLGWNAYARAEDAEGNASGSGERIEDFTMSTPVKQDYYLVAKWSRDGGFHVAYEEGRHGKLAGAVHGRLEDPKTYRTNAKAPVRYVPAAEEGWVFTGWLINDEIPKEDGEQYGSGDKVAYRDSYATTADNGRAFVVLVAQYERKDRRTVVTYHSNYPAGQNKAPHTVETEDGDSIRQNGSFTIGDPADMGFAERNGSDIFYTVPDGSVFRFVRWTNTDGETIWSGEDGREYFAPGEIAAAGREDNRNQPKTNDLYATWVPVNAETPEKEPEEEPEKDPETADPDSEDHPDDDPDPDTDEPVSGDVMGDFEDEEIRISDSSAKTEFTPEKAGPGRPKTGDETGIVIYVGLMAAALITAILILIGRRRLQK